VNYRTKQRLWKAFVYFVMIVIVLVCLFPVVWSCIISFKTVGEKVSRLYLVKIKINALLIKCDNTVGKILPARIAIKANAVPQQN